MPHFLKRLRVYVDTSVFGGCFDDEFSEDSLLFFEKARNGKFQLVISATTLAELKGAPPEVLNVLTTLHKESIEIFEPSDEIIHLRDAYIKAGVLGKASILDATHVASASVAGTDMVVSWNFKHIVHYEKILGFHAVNLINGYPLVAIYSPKEVI